MNEEEREQFKAKITELSSKVHDMANKAQISILALQLQNFKLKEALQHVVNFDWNAWTEAKKLLEEIKKSENE